MKRFLLPAVAFLMTASVCHAEWGIIGSEHAKLKNHAIIGVGDVTKQSRHDPATYRTVEWYEFRESLGPTICLVPSGLPGLPRLPSFGGTSALLLVDTNKQLRLAEFTTGIGSIEVKVKDVSLVQCPNF